MFRRVWNFLIARNSKLAFGGLALACAIGGVIAWVGFNTALETTNSIDFCVSCHEMKDTVYVEYTKSVHYQNASGVRAGCPDCHVPHAWVPKMIRKIKASKEIFHKLMGTIDTPEKFEAHRLELAQDVWAGMKETNSRECRGCHSFEYMDFHKQRDQARDAMEKAMKAGDTCISCHKGIAHKLPDMSGGYKALFNDLLASSKQLAAKNGDTIYNLTTKPFFLQRADAKPDASPDGKLLAASAVKVLAVDGDWLQVRIDGWQQDGAERMLYALQGKRIFTAALGAAAVEQVERQQTITDPDTDLVWYQGAITGWISKEAMVSDLNKLWTYGSEMYNSTCAMCHSLQPTGHYLANQWIGNLNAMKRFISLDDEQYRFLQKYIQMHAQDTGGAHG